MCGNYLRWVLAAGVAVLVRIRASDPALVLALALLGLIEVLAAFVLLDLGTVLPWCSAW